MALHWRPVGPEPASTYWLRRALVLAGALVVLALAVTGLSARGGPATDTLSSASPAAVPSSPATSPAAVPSPAATAAPAAAAGAGPAGPTPSPTLGPCDPDRLTLAARAERSRYPVGARPRLTLSVTNTGPTPCTRDLGQAAVEVLVVSGNDRIWSSDDCAPGGAIAVRTLAPDTAQTVSTTWPGIRSEPNCAGSAPPARAGTYRVDGRVGQLRFSGQTFVLTG